MKQTNKDIITNKFNSKGKWALVIGDVMLDKYIFGGRLANYKYYDMDDTIEAALSLTAKELYPTDDK